MLISDANVIKNDLSTVEKKVKSKDSCTKDTFMYVQLYMYIN